MSVMGDLLQLIERDIPIGRKHLRESHDNLENVAQYCEENYSEARDKRHALEETKNYTTQSLASVAYQINTLATNFLHLLDLQMNQMSDIESGVNHISQNVMIHKEKVARREIGVLTTNKTTTKPPGVKTPGIIFPEQPERPVKYVRKSIDYGELDEVGHGVKQAQPQNPVKRRTSSSGSSGSKVIAGAAQASQAPTTKPPNPPTTGIYSRTGGMGTLSRQSSSPYRTPAPPVSPPALPSHYAPNYPRQPTAQPPQAPQDGPPTDRRSGYSSLRAMGMPPQAPPPAPPTGMVQPMTHVGRMSGVYPGTQAPQNPPPTPPLPPMPDVSMYSSESPPPPPPESPFAGRLSNSSPPLPPPPQARASFQFSAPPAMFDAEGGQQYGQEFRGSLSQPDSREIVTNKPAEYIEKVVAIYDYAKDKDDELTFSEGSLIYVVKKNDDGWWEGVMDGMTGLFPGNYVEPCI